MIEIKDIEKLASLARIALAQEEKQQLSRDLESILGYVSELKSAPMSDLLPEEAYVKNVMRADLDPYRPEEYTAEILAEAPDRADNYFKVKKIFE